MVQPPAFRSTMDTLDNGLRVVTVELPHLHNTAIVMYAKVGSRYETPADNGLSHFLEHMLFRGTEKYPSSFALNYAIESLGGTLYAVTGRDYSLYQISLDPELVEQGIELFAEIFSAPAFTQIELERKIVLEEINEDLDEKGTTSTSTICRARRPSPTIRWGRRSPARRPTSSASTSPIAAATSRHSTARRT